MRSIHGAVTTTLHTLLVLRFPEESRRKIRVNLSIKNIRAFQQNHTDVRSTVVCSVYQSIYVLYWHQNYCPFSQKALVIAQIHIKAKSCKLRLFNYLR